MKKVEITRNYVSYRGQIGEVIGHQGDDAPVWAVKMPDGQIIHPCTPKLGKMAECKIHSETPKQLPIFN